MRRYRIRHRSHFRYTSPVVTSVHHLHLQPRICDGQLNEFFQLKVEPIYAYSQLLLEATAPSPVTVSDTWGNPMVVTQQAQTFDELAFTSLAQVAVTRQAPELVPGSCTWEAAVAAASENHDPEIQEYRWGSSFCRRDAMDAILSEFTAACFQPGRPALEALLAFTEYIFHSFAYDPRGHRHRHAPGRGHRQRRGVCQDFAHVAISALRSLGFPAATSAATSKPCRLRVKPVSRAPTPATPGLVLASGHRLG